ncbi:DUF6415 family natural product biosynthesis protein [Streptomyces sp. ATE26]|uniref:DUF6415 family natural product biosynthesis protein n=1 Tax=Streptomyces sp. ATE26 TaxID=2954237 RepID=UPI002482D7BE|nr:DUF6415 family natural product biosynthesis protein [Streptomyces sp. ATE26]MDI1455290.1 DUF6415 family natural product biosynthesis protein [Streptomyces sp. ATE26]
MRTLHSIDADRIRRTYTTVLSETRISRPDLHSEEQRANLAGILRGQLRLLLEELEGRMDQYHGETRATAVHVASRTRAALTVEDPAAARDPEHLHDMAILARSLLTLCRLPTQPPPGPQTPVSHRIP